MEPERYGATYPGHKFPMRDWFLATGLPYLYAWCKRKPPSPVFFFFWRNHSVAPMSWSCYQVKILYNCTFTFSNVLSSWKAMLHVIYLRLPLQLCVSWHNSKWIEMWAKYMINMVGAPCRREHYGGEGGEWDLESSQPHPCGVQGYKSNEHSHIDSFSLQEGDPMGKLFAIYSLLPLVIVIIFATTFFIRFLLMNLCCLKLNFAFIMPFLR